MHLKSSELILNGDGSIFHLKLFPGDIADTIILVGDPKRVEMVSAFFDSIEIRKSNREFVTHTGTFRQSRITALSTGIGTDNMDIVLNELDALANIDLAGRRLKTTRRSLRLVRIGTTGGLQQDIPINSFILSRYAAGFDTVLNFYADRNKVADLAMERAFKRHTDWNPVLPDPYFVRSSDELFQLFPPETHNGITISAPGFYGPQGRSIRLQPLDPELNDKLESFRYGDLRITNYEMESSALFGLAQLLGHRAVTLCAMIANRTSQEFTEDYKGVVNKLIKFTLEHLCPEG
ncbi:MAG: phosphorylase [Bacteroides sp. SM1_62]|nr:MAG: phosphorylase [Bacteroides sp. SM23_62]KPL20169.1 MAG: phosphorylase [Bacteroides sp. SM1_62]